MVNQPSSLQLGGAGLLCTSPSVQIWEDVPSWVRWRDSLIAQGDNLFHFRRIFFSILLLYSICGFFYSQVWRLAILMIDDAMNIGWTLETSHFHFFDRLIQFNSKPPTPALAGTHTYES